MPGDIPHPSETKSWPSWFYPPETDPADPAAHGKVFHSHEDVPEGWAADWNAHGVNLSREPPPPPEPTMTRRELHAELAKRDVAFSPTAGRAELQRLLDDALEAEALDERTMAIRFSPMRAKS